MNAAPGAFRGNAATTATVMASLGSPFRPLSFSLLFSSQYAIRRACTRAHANDRRTDAQTDGRTDEWMDGRTDGRMGIQDSWLRREARARTERRLPVSHLRPLTTASVRERQSVTPPAASQSVSQSVLGPDPSYAPHLAPSFLFHSSPRLSSPSSTFTTNLLYTYTQRETPQGTRGDTCTCTRGGCARARKASQRGVPR